ncbi:MAG: carboxylate-amine ligase [Rivularia sp. (in: Bacteria)]|nr:carboxylate-amine ligase [Rivularia sp. MS3]
MAPQTEDFTIGVEEEYQIINPQTRELTSRVEQILPFAKKVIGEKVHPEVQLSQIEIDTPVCQTLSEVRRELVRLRKGVIDAAAQDGNQIASCGTHPFSTWKEQDVTPKQRYQNLIEEYQQLGKEQVIFGCHVHIGISDRDLAVEVINRARVWLAPMLALSASSPFWMGTDTGYSSYRTEIFGRWPISGPPLIFESVDDYKRVVEALVKSKSVEEETKIYWDMRLCVKYPTVEFRMADVCMTVDEAVMIAGLTRALARTCYEQAKNEASYPKARHELIRAAHWRAARYGLDAELLDVEEQSAVPAQELIHKFLTFLRPSLEEYGDWDEVSTIAEQIIHEGTAASRQRQIYNRAGKLEDVVDYIVEQTKKGIG